MRNYSQSIKLEALGNAITNEAVGSKFNSDNKFAYLVFIDSLAPIQFEILQIFES